MPAWGRTPGAAGGARGEAQAGGVVVTWSLARTIQEQSHRTSWCFRYVENGLRVPLRVDDDVVRSSRSMNIAVFGWYHHQNAGDDRMQQCITRWFDGHTLAFLPAGRPVPMDWLRTYDGVILGGGGILMSRGGMFRDMASWIRRFGGPVALCGVSAESLPDDLAGELRAALDVMSFAWFRDQGSLDAVGPHPRAFVAPDLSWLYPFEECDPGQGTAIGLRREGDFPVDAWRAAFDDLDGPRLPWPLYFESGGDAELAERLLGLEPGASGREFSVEVARRAARIVTGRFHGLTFGMQLGRPVLTVSSRPKVARFLEEHGLGDWRVDEHDAAAFQALWPRFLEAEADILDRFRDLRGRLAEQVVDRSREPRARFLEEAASRARRNSGLGSGLRRVLGSGLRRVISRGNS